MSPHKKQNWWSFTVDPEIRHDKEKNKLIGEQEINPLLSGDRKLLNYNTYIGLEGLLDCQTSSSVIPDERAFIITHQIFELMFKLMVFDMTVIVETFQSLLAIKNKSRFLEKIKGGEDFWSPALTASARIKLSSKELLRSVMKYLKGDSGSHETFSHIEFFYFRDYLEPASGFQSAQFRLIQRAFGKSNLLSIRLFPGETFHKHYRGKENSNANVMVTDALIMGEDATVATPDTNSPLQRAAQVDNIAHEVLGRLASCHDVAPFLIPSISKIETREIQKAREILKAILDKKTKDAGLIGNEYTRRKQRDDQALRIFESDFKKSAGKENQRRERLIKARKGAMYLYTEASNSHLFKVLNNLLAADQGLHASTPDSFLIDHYDVAKKRIGGVKKYAKELNQPEPPSGTGGGGIEYLGWAIKYLIPHFPALIAFRGLDTLAPAESN